MYSLKGEKKRGEGRVWVRKTVAHSESPVVTHKPAVHRAGERCHRADGGETRWPADTGGAVNIWV